MTRTENEPRQDKKRLRTKEHFVRFSRKVVLHRIDTAESLEDRLWWAIILWSWCGPQTCDYVALKDDEGFLSKVSLPLEQEKLVVNASPDERKLVRKTSPIPAKCIDLLRLLGLGEGAQGNASRALARLEYKGSIVRNDGKIYPVKEPVRPSPSASSPPEKPLFEIGRFTLTSLDLDRLSLERRHELEEVLKQASDEVAETVAAHLAAIKTCIKDKEKWAVEQVSSFGIIIDLKSKKSKRESSSSSRVEEEATTTQQAPNPEPPPEPRMHHEPEVVQNLSHEETQAAPKPRTVLQKLAKRMSGPQAVWDGKAINQLWSSMKAKDSTLTGYDVLCACQSKLAQKRNVDNVIGFVLTALPAMVGDEGWKFIKEQAAKRAAVERDELSRVQEMLEKPDIDDYERRQWEKFLEQVELLE